MTQAYLISYAIYVYTYRYTYLISYVICIYGERERERSFTMFQGTTKTYSSTSDMPLHF